MQLDFKSVEKIDIDDLEVGDVVVTRDGGHNLIVNDVDGRDIRFINLELLRTTDYFRTPRDVIECFELDVVRIIKSDNIEIREK